MLKIATRDKSNPGWGEDQEVQVAAPGSFAQVKILIQKFCTGKIITKFFCTGQNSRTKVLHRLKFSYKSFAQLLKFSYKSLVHVRILIQIWKKGQIIELKRFKRQIRKNQANSSIQSQKRSLQVSNYNRYRQQSKM